jgi:hypothetical protein
LTERSTQKNPYILRIEELEKKLGNLERSLSEKLKSEERPVPSPIPIKQAKPLGHPKIPSYMQFCPTCGDRNPDFKDEVRCRECGMHLGETEAARKLEACPNCGASGKVLERV